MLVLREPTRCSCLIQVVRRFEESGQLTNPYEGLINELGHAELSGDGPGVGRGSSKLGAAQLDRLAVRIVELGSLSTKALWSRAAAAGWADDTLQALVDRDRALRHGRKRCDVDAFTARMEKLTTTELQKRAGMSGVDPAQLHGIKKRSDLIELLLKTEETQKVISSHDEEPVFGLTSALWVEPPKRRGKRSESERVARHSLDRLEKVRHHTRHWVADSCEFCDISYIDCEHLQWALKRYWPPTERNNQRGGQSAMERLAWVELGLDSNASTEQIDGFLAKQPSKTVISSAARFAIDTIGDVMKANRPAASPGRRPPSPDGRQPTAGSGAGSSAVEARLDQLQTDQTELAESLDGLRVRCSVVSPQLLYGTVVDCHAAVPKR